ncbi:hypothetical protein CMI47_16870 [Candidatus Pacearchaeota archaeon]|nr:hypothetical protein [Candidatus Pacearchaeota archaeon]
MVEEKYFTEYRQGTRWNQRPDATYKYMECKLCGQMAPVCEDTTAVTCSDCIAESWEPFNNAQKLSDKPRGWTLMKEFVDKNGNVYHKGKEQQELKGTLKPTKIKKSDIPTKRLTKKEKRKLMTIGALNLHNLKKQYLKARWKKDKKLIASEIKLHTKIALGKFPRNFDRKEYLVKYENN